MVGTSTAVDKRTKATFWQVLIYTICKILLGLVEKVPVLCSVALISNAASDMH